MWQLTLAKVLMVIMALAFVIGLGVWLYGFLY